MISVEHLRVEFGAKPLFSDATFVIGDRDRIALVTAPASLPCLRYFAACSSPRRAR